MQPESSESEVQGRGGGAILRLLLFGGEAGDGLFDG